MKNIIILLLIGLFELWARSAFAQNNPAIPYVNEDACPFECCQYGKWMATKEIHAYNRPDLESEILFTLQEDENFIAERGDVITIRTGKWAIRDTVELFSLDKKRVTLMPGDTLHVLHYLGEGYFKVWYKGEEYESPQRIWNPYDGRKVAKEIEVGETQWWVSIRNSAGENGWILKQSNVRGSDACG